MTDPTTLEILTLNCWGLKYIAAHRHARLSEIGARLAARHPPLDIVGLQECWTQKDYLSIHEQTKTILPHAKFYHSGIFGGGLAILSKWPIEESSMVRFPLNGRPSAFYRGDWYVGKGVACARIRLGEGRGPGKKANVVEVFCTHLHAPYEAEPHDSYLCHRTAQAWEMAKLMRHAAERGHLVVGLGDFNMVPSSLAHQIITTHAPVADAWRVLHPDSSLGSTTSEAERARGRAVPSIEYNLRENGATCDSAWNTWRWDKPARKKLARGGEVRVDVRAPDPWAKRLDYIFVGGDPFRGSCGGEEKEEPRGKWTLAAIKLGMTAPHPTLKCSLSDHFSIEASLRFSSPSPSPSPIPESIPTPNPLPPLPYHQILSLIKTYTKQALHQRRLRLTHFGAQLVISAACLVGVWWTPRPFVAFLLLLASTLGTAAGVVDGLIGGLFVRSEVSALREFAWEVESARKMVDEGGGGG
ncbi:MAG: phospholipase C type enzyme [Piccolia ochrophora]|nr:MAG: phospholipase C type enzyme [Piccolia ochrophora]